MHKLLCSFALASALLASGVTFAAVQSNATTLTILSSGGIMGAIRAVAPDYEKLAGVRLNIVAAPSMGETPQAIPNRLARKEPADVVLMVGSALSKLAEQGQVDKATQVDLGESFIAMAVRKGAEKPNISDMASFEKTLLQSRSVAYSDSASGVYLSRVLFPRMKLGSEFSNKARMIPAEPVGAVVARGDAQIGFQQLSELKPVTGIDIVGLIPDRAQQMTMYSGAIVSGTGHAAQAQELLNYMRSDAAAKAIENSGLKPVAIRPGSAPSAN